MQIQQKAGFSQKGCRTVQLEGDKLIHAARLNQQNLSSVRLRCTPALGSTAATNLPRPARTRRRSLLPSRQLKAGGEFGEGTKRRWHHTQDWGRSSISTAAAASQSSPLQAFMEKKTVLREDFERGK